MKKLVILVAAMMLAGTAWASMDGPPAHVTAEIDPLLGVTAGTYANVYLGSLPAATATDATVSFRIDANQEHVWVKIAATDLWKGNDLPAVGDPTYLIPLVTAEGAEVVPDSGHEVDPDPLGAGGVPEDNLLDFLGAALGPTIENLPSTLTEVGKFESTQGGHFSQ